MSEFTPEQVERAAEALWAIARVHGSSYSKSWEALHECAKSRYRRDARAVLSAAGAPERVAPVRIDPSELAALIYSIEYGTDPDSAEPGDIEDRLGMADELIEWFAEKHIPVVVDAALAAVATYLRGESK